MNALYPPFVFSLAFGILAWGAVANRYIWPALKKRDLRAGAEPILYLHLFRYIGLAFLIPGVVGPDLQPQWAKPTAYGDVGAALLAGGCLLIGRRTGFRPLLWIFNVWGTLDLLMAVATGPVYDVVPSLRSTFFIPAVGVPLLLWTHAIIFMLLFRRRLL